MKHAVIGQATLIATIVRKELQQDLRRRGFVVFFLAVHLILLLILVPVYAGGGVLEPQDQRGLAIAVWMVVAGVIGFVMPFRCFLGLHEETDKRQLELILLTRISARHLAIGKWLAASVQSALMAAAVLPYLAILYFLGGIELPMFLIGMTLLFFFSLTLSAVGISLWGFQQARLVMSIAMLLLVPSAITLLQSLKVVPHFGSDLLWLIAKVVLLLTPLIVLLLEMGAARLAPRGESYTFSKRFLALLLAALVAVVDVYDPVTARLALTPLFVAGGLVALGSIFEIRSGVAADYRPFVRLGVLGKLLGRFFYAGWACGVPFTLLLACIFSFQISKIFELPLQQVLLIAGMSLGCHAFAFIISKYFMFREQGVTPIKYLFTHAGLSLVVAAVTATRQEGLIAAFGLVIPHFFLADSTTRWLDQSTPIEKLPSPLFSGFAYLCVLIFLAVRNLKGIRRIEKRTEELFVA